MLRILFLCSATHTADMRNLNHFQRVYFLSRANDLTVFARREADFSASAAANAKIVRSRWRSKPLVAISFLAWWLRHGRHLGFDVVLTEPSLLLLGGWFSKLFGRHAWVLDVWDMPFRAQRPAWLTRVYCRCMRMLARFALLRVDLCLMSIRPEYEFRCFGVSPDRMLLLKNAVWTEGTPIGDDVAQHAACGTQPQSITLLCMKSGFAESSGLDVLHQLCAILQRRAPTRVRIIGRLADECGKPLLPRSCESYDLLGPLSHAETLQQIARADVCVIPYHDCPDLAQIYPIKVFEYMLAGRLVLAADLPGIRDIIQDGVNGILFRPGDAHEAADKLMQALTSGRAALMARQARTDALHYDCRSKAVAIQKALAGFQRTASGRSGSAPGPVP